ncbi:MAG TPA: alpha/beta fold hydrolase [Vicinamibacteria bacterium]|nr:alpha/beta fold hydrolase [Vicinamibacteria bacterium]
MKARIGGADIQYQVSGQGPAVLFLHAFPLGLTMWDDQDAALQPAHQVVRFDARGFGGSPPGDGLLSMERIADDAAGLLDHLGLGQAVVVGCSMGGYAAFAMIRRHPERVRALVLQDTRAGADVPVARANRSALAQQVMKEGPRAAAEAFLPRLLGGSTQQERPQIVERIRRIILGTSPRGIADALIGLAARADSTPTLREIRVPTLVMVGEEDVLTPPPEAEAMVQAIAGASLTVIPKAGHLANLENPEAFNQALLGFLGTLWA